MKVLLKILKKNVRNSIVCFMSTILVAIILFVFLGVKELVLGTYIAVYWSDFDQLYSKQL